jgi:hypothetical protein
MIAPADMIANLMAFAKIRADASVLFIASPVFYLTQPPIT